MSAVLSEALAGGTTQPRAARAPVANLQTMCASLLRLAERDRDLDLAVTIRRFRDALSETAQRFLSGDAAAVNEFLEEFGIEQEFRGSVERRPDAAACGGAAGLVEQCRRELGAMVREGRTPELRAARRLVVLGHLAQLQVLAGANTNGAPRAARRAPAAGEGARGKARPARRAAAAEGGHGGLAAGHAGDLRLTVTQARLLSRAPQATEDLPEDVSAYNTSLRSLERRGLVELSRDASRLNAHGHAVWCWRRCPDTGVEKAKT